MPSGTVTPANTGATTGQVLATVEYAPAVLTTYNVASTSLVALDATNLTVSFTVPASGKVMVDFYASISNPANVAILFGLLPHGGGTQVGHAYWVFYQGSSAAQPRAHAKWPLSGLTPGALQLDVAAALSTGVGPGNVFAITNDAAHYNAGSRGPATIVVTSA